jgi:prepilin-type processing-associated H-X9-DG protein
MGTRTHEEISISVIEKNGFDVLFWDGHTLINTRGSSSNIATIFGGRERKWYRIKGQPMKAMKSSSRVANKKELVALKVSIWLTGLNSPKTIKGYSSVHGPN